MNSTIIENGIDLQFQYEKYSNKVIIERAFENLKNGKNKSMDPKDVGELISIIRFFNGNYR